MKDPDLVGKALRIKGLISHQTVGGRWRHEGRKGASVGGTRGPPPACPADPRPACPLPASLARFLSQTNRLSG